MKKNEVGVEEFYEESKDGGRTLSDGKTKIEWSVSFPLPRYPRGSIPFYCGVSFIAVIIMYITYFKHL